MTEVRLPVVVIGAGPVGLAAAAHLIAAGEEPLVFEVGTTVGASVREWGNVRLFSPLSLAGQAGGDEGSFEQHGPHLPLATDTLVASAIAATIAETYPVLRLPPVTISCSHEHADFPGTVSISAATLVAIVTDVAGSLRRQGVSGLLVINGHGGNYLLAKPSSR